MAHTRRTLFILVLLFTTLIGNSRSGHGQAAAAQFGLEWPGDGAVRRMLYWHNPFPIYDATYIFKVYPRKKTTGEFKYYTTFFWGNDGNFTWDAQNVANTYYGAHPYPIPAPSGPGQWEISVRSLDITSGQEVDWDRWHTQAFRAWRESDSKTHHEFYYDLPDTSKVVEFTVEDPRWAKQNPPTPAIVIGQAPNLNGLSWGGYPGWEEFNGIIRGIQIYSGLLSVDEIQAEIASPASTTNGRNQMWYLNLDPRPGDVADKKGFGTAHNPSWDGTTAFEWTNQVADIIPPAATIVTPAQGSLLRGLTPIFANASDNMAVVGVQFKLDGANLLAEDTAAPYAINWNTANIADGSHTLTAVARDAAGNETTSAPVDVTVGNDASRITVTSPASGETITAKTVQVTATASRNVTGVQFQLDGVNLGAEDTSAPYSVQWDTGAAANGPHTLAAVARDPNGNKTTSPAVAVVLARDSAAPSVTMTAPQAGAIVSGLSVTVSATASDDIAVAGVQFKLDGVDLGAEDTTAPYSITWNTVRVGAGAHSLSAVARDAAGNQTASAPIIVTVRRLQGQ